MSKELTVVETAQELAVTKRDNYLLRKEGITRFVSRKANVMRTDSVTEFKGYIDSEGNASSNAGMYNAGLNTLVVKLFEKTKDQMSELELEAVTAIDLDIALAHDAGIKNKLTRKQIRDNAREIAKRGYANFKEKMKFLGIE
jgi:hypothetical protein